MTTKQEIRPGDFVSYTDSRGLEKTALVTATPDTVTPGHRVPELEATELHLMVFSPSGSAYPRQNVIRAETPLEGSGSWAPR
jgi:hypothetical protein